jgi:hypothetical protein
MSFSEGPNVTATAVSIAAFTLTSCALNVSMLIRICSRGETSLDLACTVFHACPTYATMPRRGNASGPRAQAATIVQATISLSEQISLAGALRDLQQHQQACNALRLAVTDCVSNNAVLQELVLQTEFAGQLLALVGVVLQHVAEAGSSVGPEEPALLAAAYIAACINAVLGAYSIAECQPRVVNAMQQSGETILWMPVQVLPEHAVVKPAQL